MATLNVFNPTNSTDIVNFGVITNQTNQQSINLFTVSNKGTVTINTRNQSKALLVYNTAGFKILQLDNSGTLHARQIEVDLNNWPDFVFETNYKLMPIEQVALYIKKYKHLPNIPTALDVETNGLNLGSMQKMMMQKIEELTIYTIKQNEETKKLESENELLRTELENLKNEVSEIKTLLNK